MRHHTQEPGLDMRSSLEAEMTAWRHAHPTASLTEIEAALDACLARVRAALLDTAAHATPAADWRTAPPEQHPVCPHCSTRLQARGKHRRRLRTHGDQVLTLERSYGVCPACGTGLFPPG